MSDVTPHTGAKFKVTRRGLIVGAAATCAAGGVFAANWFNVGATIAGGALTVSDAHNKANAGDVFLIDIRRPDEWARTGVGEGAHPIDMRRDDFTQALLVLTKGATDAPVALICARGVRSRKMTERLTAAGFSQIIDVPEGMLGSGAGPGWLRAGLPVVAVQ
ncbi:MAG: rhodanese-like domain-containing protein [Aliishimia sp.]